jgi:hypothetical protein
LTISAQCRYREAVSRMTWPLQSRYGPGFDCGRLYPSLSMILRVSVAAASAAPRRLKTTPAMPSGSERSPSRVCSVPTRLWPRRSASSAAAARTRSMRGVSCFPASASSGDDGRNQLSGHVGLLAVIERILSRSRPPVFAMPGCRLKWIERSRFARHAEATAAVRETPGRRPQRKPRSRPSTRSSRGNPVALRGQPRALGRRPLVARGVRPLTLKRGSLMKQLLLPVVGR